MDVSPNTLRKETVAVSKQIDEQLIEVGRFAEELGIRPAQVRDQNGNYPMISLLLAKAQCLNTLTLLREQGRKR